MINFMNLTLLFWKTHYLADWTREILVSLATEKSVDFDSEYSIIVRLNNKNKKGYNTDRNK